MVSWLKSFFGAKDSAVSNFNSSNLQEGLYALHEGTKFLLLKDFETALPYFDKTIEYDVEEGYKQRAICLQALSYHIDALADFDKAIQLSPEDCNIYFMRALSKVQLGDNDGAIFDMHTAIRLSQVKNEINRVYNEARIKNGEGSLHDFYTLNLSGIAAMAKLNDQMRKYNRRIPYTSLRRPIN